MEDGRLVLRPNPGAKAIIQRTGGGRTLTSQEFDEHFGHLQTTSRSRRTARWSALRLEVRVDDLSVLDDLGRASSPPACGMARSGPCSDLVGAAHVLAFAGYHGKHSRELRLGCPSASIRAARACAAAAWAHDAANDAGLTITRVAMTPKKLNIGDLVEVDTRRYDVVPDKLPGVTLDPAVTRTAEEIHTDLGGRRLTAEEFEKLFGHLPSDGEA